MRRRALLVGRILISLALPILVTCPVLRAESAETTVEVEADARNFAVRDLTPGPARLSSWSSGVDLSVPLAGNRNFGLGLEIDAHREGYHFSDFDTFLAGMAAPLSRARDVILQPTLLLTPSASWTWVVSPDLEYSAADQATSKEARLWSGSIAVFHTDGAKRKLGLGLTVAQRMKASSLILPFPVIDWTIAERWTLRSLDGNSGRLSWDTDSKFGFFGQLEFRSRDLRLAPSSSISSGIIRVEDFPVTVGIEYRPGKHATLSVAAGKALAQTYRFENRDGSLLRASSPHAPALLTLDLDLTW